MATKTTNPEDQDLSDDNTIFARPGNTSPTHADTPISVPPRGRGGRARGSSTRTRTTVSQIPPLQATIASTSKAPQDTPTSAPPSSGDSNELLQQILARLIQLETKEQDVSATVPLAPLPLAPSIEHEPYKASRQPSQETNSSITQRHTIKLKDPSPLSDGISPTFEEWETDTLHKLEYNAWLFPDKGTRFAWLTTLVSGTAKTILAPQIDRNYPDPCTTTQEVFDLLRTSFSNPDSKGAARDQLAVFQMEPNVEFFEFCAEFVRLASVAGTAQSEWKYELNRRLTEQLRISVLSYYLDQSLNFQGFRAKCSASHQQLREIARQRVKRREARSIRPAPTPTQRTSNTAEDPTHSVLQTPFHSRAYTTPEPSRKVRGTTRQHTLTPSPEAAANKPSPVPTEHSCYSCGKAGYYAN